MNLVKIFNLYPGEQRSAILFAILSFLWSLGSYCSVTLADGMFLEHVGAFGLPKAYLLTALSLFAIAVLFLYAFNHFDAHRLYIASLFFGIAGFAIFALSSKGANTTYWLTLKIFAYTLNVVLTTCFWFFLDQYFNLQNAKRLYSLFNASIFLGNACGGALLALTLNQIGLVGILIAASASFVATIMWLYQIKDRVEPILDDSLESQETPEKLPLKQVLRGFLLSRYTLLLMGFYFLIQLINIVTEYTYMQSFDAYFDQPRSVTHLQSNELTIFLGKCTAWIALGNVIFGFFAYSRIVSRTGIANFLGLSPICFLLVYGFWHFSDALFIAVLGLVVVEGISYTIDENNSNLLINTIPSHLKNKARVAIDSFFEPLGMLVSALFFLLLTIPSKNLGLVLTAISIIFVFAIRSEYGKAVLINLLHNALHFERSAKEWLKRLGRKEKAASSFQLISSLRQGDEKLRLFAFEALLQFEDLKAMPRLLSQISAMSMRGKIKALSLLQISRFAKDPGVLELLNDWMMRTPASSLKSSIMLYFAKLGLLNPAKASKDLTSEDPQARAAAIISFKTSPTKNQKEETQIHEERLLRSHKAEEICMGLLVLGFEHSPRNIDLLIPYLKHPSVKVATTAAQALASITHPHIAQFAPLLLSLVQSSPHSNFRIACLAALGNLKDSSLAPKMILASYHFRPVEKRALEGIVSGIGLSIFPYLLALAKDTSVHDRARILAVRILGNIALPQLRAHLEDIVEKEIERAHFYLYYSQTLDDPSLGLLRGGLATSYESTIDFIIQLLGVAGSIENSELLSRSLRSRNPKTRGTAVEMVEKTCESRIFHKLKVLIDDRPMEEKVRLYRKQARVSLEELLQILLESSSKSNQIIALTLMAKSNYPNWRSALRKQMLAGDETFINFAYELLES